MPIDRANSSYIATPNGNRMQVLETHPLLGGGEPEHQRYTCPLIWDFDAELAAHADSIDKNLIKREASQGTDIVPVHQTQAEYDRRALGFLMTETDAHKFLAALPFWQAVESRGGANANARAAYLGVSRANYDLVNKRFGDVQGAASFLNNSKGQIWSDIPAEFS